jgi:hypothetical protein
MEGKFDDFIGVWEDHVPKFVCDKAIKHIDEVLLNCSTNQLQLNDSMDIEPMEGDRQFKTKNLGRQDYSVMINHTAAALCNEFNQYLHSCFLDYIDQYGQLANTPLIATDSKLQRTEPMGGYHVWHYEDTGYDMAQRVLVWMIYLNDLPEGEGETEFLYQKRRIRPKRGTCVIWPAGYTHVHRGLTVYSQNKYILTGWYINAPVLRY